MMALMREPAFWSAVAAWFALLSSVMVLLAQRRNLLESVRPELVLVDWTRFASGQGAAGYEVIAFKSIKNVGRGVAFDVRVDCSHEVRHRSAVVSESKVVPLLAVNEASNVNGEIVVWWNNVAGTQEVKSLAITLTITCLDSRGLRHVTRYGLSSIGPKLPPGTKTVGAAHQIAPGVALVHRSTATRAPWRTKLERWVWS
ncbi:MAG TPA: hypothetical protein VML91_05240 [Burkholderiales bacterium]|nr:hypothetical protein [Burkholderiales bacterium]